VYAIIETGGTQHRVEPGMKIEVPRLPNAEGENFTFDRVLLVVKDDKVVVGHPYIDGVKVSATVSSHFRGRKIIVFKRKNRKGYEKTQGHRRDLTTVLIDKITKS
jgi:large subunit ribosomal protein L21